MTMNVDSDGIINKTDFRTRNEKSKSEGRRKSGHGRHVGRVSHQNLESLIPFHVYQGVRSLRK